VTEYYEYELGKAAKILINELVKVKPGEIVAITADTGSDRRVVAATATAAFAAGGLPLVMTIASPLGVGKDSDAMTPVKSLGTALREADVWIEYNRQWLQYSTTYEIATKGNRKLRYLCYVTMDADMMTRVIGRIDYAAQKAFQIKLHDMTEASKHMRIITPAGTDVEFDNPGKVCMTNSYGYADVPGQHLLAGQIGWRPIVDSINGTIVFDGSIVPPIGLVKTPVKLHVKRGKVVEFEGGDEALKYEAWLKSFKDPLMLTLAHACYGVNPGAKLTGNILEDERVWASTEWGLGYVGPFFAPPDGIPASSHTDGICLNSSVWLDGEQILDKGRFIHPELAKLAKKLGKA
jgi:leucyl aminopeptidase (aminopeptidase T)